MLYVNQERLRLSADDLLIGAADLLMRLDLLIFEKSNRMIIEIGESFRQIKRAANKNGCSFLFSERFEF